MINVGVIGGAGYTAGELLRILVHHPNVELTSVQSGSHAGEPIFKAHPDLEGQIELVFSELISEEVDVVFLCSGHGKSKQILEDGVVPKYAKIIDLSTDFRPRNNDLGFTYGLPEILRDTIKSSDKVANPGCFATCIQLSVLPLASASKIKDSVHVTAITGSTGAGQHPTATTHYSWRSNNASAYKVLKHQHLLEVGESVKTANSDWEDSIHFVPYRGAFTRGIITTAYFQTDIASDFLLEQYQEAYETHPFTIVVDENPDLKMVINTNKAIVYPTVIDGQAVVISVIDNLLKGASGQAVQNMNLMMGFDEKLGLDLKSTGF